MHIRKKTVIVVKASIKAAAARNDGTLAYHRWKAGKIEDYNFFQFPLYDRLISDPRKPLTFVSDYVLPLAIVIAINRDKIVLLGIVSICITIFATLHD